MKAVLRWLLGPEFDFAPAVSGPLYDADGGVVSKGIQATMLVHGKNTPTLSLMRGHVAPALGRRQSLRRSGATGQSFRNKPTTVSAFYFFRIPPPSRSPR
jgi:hypothetical protein